MAEGQPTPPTPQKLLEPKLLDTAQPVAEEATVAQPVGKELPMVPPSWLPGTGAGPKPRPLAPPVAVAKAAGNPKEDEAVEILEQLYEHERDPTDLELNWSTAEVGKPAVPATSSSGLPRVQPPQQVLWRPQLPKRPLLVKLLQAKAKLSQQPQVASRGSQLQQLHADGGGGGGQLSPTAGPLSMIQKPKDGGGGERLSPTAGLVEKQHNDSRQLEEEKKLDGSLGPSLPGRVAPQHLSEKEQKKRPAPPSTPPWITQKPVSAAAPCTAKARPVAHEAGTGSATTGQSRQEERRSQSQAASGAEADGPPQEAGPTESTHTTSTTGSTAEDGSSKQMQMMQKQLEGFQRLIQEQGQQIDMMVKVKGQEAQQKAQQIEEQQRVIEEQKRVIEEQAKLNEERAREAGPRQPLHPPRRRPLRSPSPMRRIEAKRKARKLVATTPWSSRRK